MPKFFLHHKYDDGRRIRDEEGAFFANLEAARQEAVLSAREQMGQRLLQGETPIYAAIEICDEGGRNVGLVLYEDALFARLPDRRAGCVASLVARAERGPRRGR